MQEIEKQDFIKKTSTAYTDCMILKSSGSSNDEFNRCELEYIRDAREGCVKYPDLDECKQLEEKISNDEMLRKIFP